MQFDKGDGPFDVSTLELTTTDPVPNGELAPLFSDYTHWAWFNLTDPSDTLITGVLNVNKPDPVDANGDGFDDFYDPKIAVAASTSGIYKFDFEATTHPLTATWTRSAGSSTGTCVLNLAGYGDYTHTFKILNYQGPLSYIPDTNSVSSTLSITNAGDPAQYFQGPAVFDKAADNPTNHLVLQAGAWTNSTGQTLPFASGDIARDPSWPTNYYGTFHFDDNGNPLDFQPYSEWQFSIDDLHDSDHDGIPDFSDTPGEVVIGSPRLSLVRGVTNLLLQISGDTGYTADIQEKTDLASTNWVFVQSVVVTNSQQTVSLPIPDSRKFWRLVVR